MNLQWLKSNMWNILGVLLTVLGIVIATIVSYDIFHSETKMAENKTSLEVESDFSFDIISRRLLSEHRLNLRLDTFTITSVRVLPFTIRNNGNTPVEVEHFSEPLKVSINEPWEFLNVSVREKHPEELNPVWRPIGQQSFQLDPLLLNPGDRIGGYFLIMSKADTRISLEPKWSTRIVNLPSLSVVTEREKLERLKAEMQSQLKDSPPVIFITLEGGDAVIFGILSMIIFVSLYIIAVKGQKLPHLQTRQFVLIAASVLFSLHTADLIVWILFDAYEGTPRVMDEAIIIIGIFALFVLFLAYPLLHEMLRKRNRDTM